MVAMRTYVVVRVLLGGIPGTTVFQITAGSRWLLDACDGCPSDSYCVTRS